ncbi:MarR family winged helix-turn-helix transcriptional regulator [Rhodococcus wratislaviensis]|uniref:MarR family winged helix-turn-helix transcriptional regulator n=1 Tax=Rhodococcus wratislaviensis TaxID=44752 RepID=UPI003668ECA1
MTIDRFDNTLKTNDRNALEAPPDMVSAPGYLLRRLYQAYQSAWLKHVDPVATGPQAAVLMAVRSNPGVEQGALGASVAVDRSTMASIVKRLVERGWLERKRPAEDGRKRLLFLTDAGYESIDAIVRRAQELDILLMEGYGPLGQELIVDLLRSLASRWETIAED